MGKQTAAGIDIVITRIFNAPRERVWKAWTALEVYVTDPGENFLRWTSDLKVLF